MSQAGAAQQPAYDVFLSYRSEDRASVESIAHRLRDLGLNPFLDRWYLTPGQRWQSTLEDALGRCGAVAIFIGGEMGRWQRPEQEVALDRQARDASFPVIPVLLPGAAEPPLGFLRLNTWIDLRRGISDPTQLAVLAAAIRRQPPGPDSAARTIAASICPFRGLRPFREEDAPFFFGREEEAERLLADVSRQPFTAVIAASGAGKSSLVRAGLLPRLRQQSSTAAEIVTLTPTDRPIYSVAAALIPLLETEMSETRLLAELATLSDLLEKGTVALRDVIERILQKQPGTQRLLLVVDQWEELYHLAAEPAATRFIDHLLAGGPKLQVVATLRGDFVGRALGYRPLSDRLQGALFNLGPMTNAQLERVITGPAARAGLRMEDGLAARLVEEAMAERGNLPLLEFTLERLWQERDGAELTHAVYQRIGGIKGALALHAESAFERLAAAEQSMARKIFLQIVTPVQDGGYVRRRATIQEVGEAAWPVVSKLAEARLLVTARSAQRPETVELSHEALIGNWKRLEDWLKENQELLLWLDRFRVFFHEWERKEKDAALLLPGPACAEAKLRISQDATLISTEERAFLDQSTAAEERRTAAARRQRWIRWAAALLVVLAPASGGLAWWRSKQAESRRMAIDAVARIPQSPEAALCEASGAYGIWRTREAAEAMHESFQAAIEPRINAGAQAILAVKVMSDGSRMITGGDDGSVRIWAANGNSDGQLRPAVSQPGRITALAVDGQGIAASGDSEGNLAAWDLSTRDLIWSTATGKGINAVVLLPGGKLIAAGAAISECDVRAKTCTALPAGAAEQYTALAASTDGGLVAAADSAGRVTVWAGPSRTGQPSGTWQAHDTAVRALAIVSAGVLATGALDGRIRLWSIGSGKRLAEAFADHLGVARLAASPSGDLLASVAVSGQVRLWTLPSLEESLFLRARAVYQRDRSFGATDAIFLPDAKTVAAAGTDSTVRFFQVPLGILEKDVQEQIRKRGGCPR